MFKKNEGGIEKLVQWHLAATGSLLVFWEGTTQSCLASLPTRIPPTFIGFTNVNIKGYRNEGGMGKLGQ